jgi:hypothetical protein
VHRPSLPHPRRLFCGAVTTVPVRKLAAIPTAVPRVVRGKGAPVRD